MFERHDALKGGFQRERHTLLDIQDYARVFSAFCLQTYDKREFEFSRMQALDYLDKAKAITQLEYNSEDYLMDTLQAVCLLVEDGLLIVFPHRSFQEYFTARFIADTKPIIQKGLIGKYSNNIIADNVIRLLYELKPDIVEQYLILPEINKWRKVIDCNGKLGITHYARLLKETFEKFSIMDMTEDLGTKPEGKLIMAGHIKKKGGSFIDILRFTNETCGNLVAWKSYGEFFNEQEAFLKTIEFMKKYNISKDNLLKAKDFKPLSKLFRDFAELPGNIWNIEMWRKFFEVDEALKIKRKNTEISLAKILGRFE